MHIWTGIDFDVWIVLSLSLSFYFSLFYCFKNHNADRNNRLFILDLFLLFCSVFVVVVVCLLFILICVFTGDNNKTNQQMRIEHRHAYVYRRARTGHTNIHTDTG